MPWWIFGHREIGNSDKMPPNNRLWKRMLDSDMVLPKKGFYKVFRACRI
jgi:hypothetical protein